MLNKFKKYFFESAAGAWKWDRWIGALSLGLLLTFIGIYGTFYFFPAQDGPGHVLNAYALEQALFQGRPPLIGQFYAAYDPTFLLSNCVSAVWILIVQYITGYDWAYRSMVIAVILTLAWGSAQLYRSVNGRWGDGLVPGTVLVLFNHELFMGFFNWLTAIGVGMGMIALWVRTRHRSGWSAPLLSSLGWTATFWIHPLGYTVSAGILGILSIFELIQDRDGRSVRNCVLRWWAPMLPSAAAWLYYTSLLPAEGAKGLSFSTLFIMTRSVEVIRPFDSVPAWTGHALAVVFLIGVCEAALERFGGRRRPGLSDAVLCASVALAIGFVAFPFMRVPVMNDPEGLINTGRVGSYINTRMAAPGLILLCIWYGSRSSVWSRVLTVLMLALAVAHGSAIVSACRGYQNDLKEIADAGSRIPDESVVAYDSSDPRFAILQKNYYAQPYLHAAALAVAKTRGSTYIGSVRIKTSYLFPHQFLKERHRPEPDILLIWDRPSLTWGAEYKGIFRSENVSLLARSEGALEGTTEPEERRL